MNIKRDTLVTLINRAFDTTIALERELTHTGGLEAALGRELPYDQRTVEIWKQIYKTREAIYQAQSVLDETPPWEN